MEKISICIKCGYKSNSNSTIFGMTFCKICRHFAPSNLDDLKQYAEEKISSDSLNSFRKFFVPKGVQQKKGMIQKSEQGRVMSRPPFGYVFEKKKLIPAQNSDKVREIFEEFLISNCSLRKLSKKHNLSVNGLKKILRNFTYIGKVKFNQQIHEGIHPPLISTTLFNHVQNKLDKFQTKKQSSIRGLSFCSCL